MKYRQEAVILANAISVTGSKVRQVKRRHQAAPAPSSLFLFTHGSVLDMAHYGIIRQELAISYPTYGNALWEPDLGGQYSAVKVGDVGFIRRGYFQRLFNVLLPEDHPSHRNTSFVPEDHQQLVTIHDHIIKNEIRTGSRQNSLHFCSQYITLGSRGRGTSAYG